MIEATNPSLLARPDGHSVAYHHSPGKSPGVIFLGGLMSDMTGTKAVALEQALAMMGRGYTRFDYFGHGQSTGKFENGTISRWTDDVIAVLDEVTSGPQVLVGSSLGGWLMLLAALARPERVQGLVGIAAAPDFTPRMWEEFDDAAREELRTKGVYRRPSEYSEEPYPISMALIEDGNRNLLLERPIPISLPVRLLHGMRDEDVPWQTSLTLAERLESDDVAVTLVKNGDHRLSTPHDIARLVTVVERLCQILAGGE
jgi:pimeloyl-ACP methyl ester carboxylesterase